jgi:hypothetical protein
MSDLTSNQERLRKQLKQLVLELNVHIEDRKSQLLGQILTITDSSTADPTQRKAVKDLVTNAFYSGRYPGEKGGIEWEVERLGHSLGIEGDLFQQPSDEELPPEPNNPYDNIS